MDKSSPLLTFIRLEKMRVVKMLRVKITLTYIKPQLNYARTWPTYKIHPTRIENVYESSSLAEQKPQKVFTGKEKMKLVLCQVLKREGPLSCVLP
jgi:hypothetical protein